MAWKRFIGTVTDRSDLTSNMFRVEFRIRSDEAGYEYTPATAGDESVGMYFASEGRLLRTRPSAATHAHGGWETYDDGISLGRRNFTVRRYDADQALMSIDVARHASGPAIEWLRTAAPGWELLMAGPRSWHTPPTGETAPHWLVADLTGLPALARIIEQTPAATPITALIEVPHEDDLAYLPEHPRLDVVPLIGSGNGVAASRLHNRFITLPPAPSNAYHWVGAETAQVRRIKAHLRDAGHDKTRRAAVGYWNDRMHWADPGAADAARHRHRDAV